MSGRDRYASNSGAKQSARLFRATPRQDAWQQKGCHSITSSVRVQQSLEGRRGRALALPLTAAKGTSVILVLNQYKCIGCSPGKHPDTRPMATGSDDDSRDSVHDSYLCIAV